ncbi:hypothetical protein ACF07F_15805 [Streptomyces sp. NPDC015237]|uniref:hypothetical protein n=1 Tax=Streptomyces sp. NPDC015237 TaxID=3364949 RepID=UPI0036FF5822
MKHRSKIALALSGVAACTALSAAPASAHASAVNCQHSSGNGTVISAAYIERFPGDKSTGAIQLCKDSSSRYWGFTILYNALPAGQQGWSIIASYFDGDTFTGIWNCESPGGNGDIQPGQTRCWTQKIGSTSGRVTFQAEGYFWRDGETQVVAHGATAQTR